MEAAAWRNIPERGAFSGGGRDGGGKSAATRTEGRLASRRDGAEVNKTCPTEAKLPAQQEVATANSRTEEVNGCRDWIWSSRRRATSSASVASGGSNIG